MNNFKLYFRNLIKNKVFSTITIGSFTVSIAIIIVLVSFLVSEFSYDKHIKNIDNIYRLKASENQASIPEQSRALMLTEIPEIDAISNYTINYEPIVYQQSNFSAKVINSDEDLFSVLPIEFVVGSADNIFKNKQNVVITEGLSQKIFGNENPIGKVLNISHKEEVQIVALIKNFPAKSTLNGDLICSTDLKIRYSRSCYNDVCTYFYKTLIRLQNKVSVDEVSNKITSVIPKINEHDNNIYSLNPFKNVYFDTSLAHDDLQHANIKLIRLLAWLTIALLLLSIFNYINLSIGQNTTRLKEFGVKQTLGARNKSVFFQFFGEAFLTTLLATIFAFFIAYFIQPIFVELFGKHFLISSLLISPQNVFLGIMLIGVVSILSAIYPAYLATKVKAKDLLQKNTGTKSKGIDIRKSLNVIQFAATISILVSLIVITRQIEYVKTKDLGFSTEQLVRIPVHWKAKDKVNILIDEINSVSGVKNSCYSHGTPGGIWNYSQNDEFGKISVIASDKNFTETFGITVIEGRNFFQGEQNRVCLINKTAMKQAGWESFVGKKMFGYEVIGLVDDFHYENMYNQIGGLMVNNDKDVSHLTVRLLSGSTFNLIAEIEKVFKKILPDYEFAFQFYDDYLNDMYQQEEKRAASIRIIAIIAIFISCIGLIGLVEFSTKNRIKEIGIRKVNGAKVSEILSMLNKDFIKWVAIAFIIACPIAWYAMNKWLENFAYKTSLSWWIFALAGVLALGIALLTVSWQSWKAATRNPVEALRYE
ncbi:FtsX-like permease family protein [uncultured Draconibacterium sp.]|uniref:ABC transporter permease n=1 Tax=uncultured Draconibacterium sp. TaxID=1573823 RepID=UPI003261D4C4